MELTSNDYKAISDMISEGKNSLEYKKGDETISIEYNLILKVMRRMTITMVQEHSLKPQRISMLRMWRVGMKKVMIPRMTSTRTNFLNGWHKSYPLLLCK